MITTIFLLALGIATVSTLNRWERGWYAIVIVGILQDPVRKVTPGWPVAITFSVIAPYLAMVFIAWAHLQTSRRDLEQRFPDLAAGMKVLLAIIFFAALNGVLSYGVEYWTVPALSLATYLLPLPAILLGYAFFDREETVLRFFRFYAVVTSVALVGTILEYVRVQSPLLGLVTRQGDVLRHVAGYNMRLLSGFYRAPDVMAWHAATLTIVALILSLRASTARAAMLWIAVAGWGFTSAMLSGRRKAMLYVLVFALVLVWRYFRRMNVGQLVTFTIGLLALLGVIQLMARQESEARIYARGSTEATTSELLSRLEGGSIETIGQLGIFGGGLGTATQGAQHLRPGGVKGWQEGGLAKLFAEIGVPGVLALAVLAGIALSLLYRASGVPDLPGSSQIVRVGLFAMAIGNAVKFTTSAQAYSDPGLALLTAFFIGALFSSLRFDETFSSVTPEPLRTGNLPVPHPTQAASSA
ncbi:MAG: hypothetical protein WA208_09520 [Thermoanaerobaculia bacterium]